MNLINCPDCNRFVSKNADKCPKCGRPIRDDIQYVQNYNQNKKEKEKEDFKKVKIGCLALIFILALLCSIPFLLDSSLTEEEKQRIREENQKEIAEVLPKLEANIGISRENGVLKKIDCYNFSVYVNPIKFKIISFDQKRIFAESVSIYCSIERTNRVSTYTIDIYDYTSRKNWLNTEHLVLSSSIRKLFFTQRERKIGMNSKIEWTECTWNPATGCTKVSPGCKYCYAERMAHRLKAMGQPNYVNGFDVAIHEHALKIPLKWKKPKTIFVNSMSDLFHPEIPTEFIHKVFDVMGKADWHLFQVLTKRSERLLELNPELAWKPNIWMGVSVETEKYKDRIGHLRLTDAHTKFLSCEPLLGKIPDMNLEGIDWVIVGGESGPKSRPMDEEWVIDIRDQCTISGTPFFFKQWGGVNKKKAGRELEGKTWSQMPNDLI